MRTKATVISLLFGLLIVSALVFALNNKKLSQRQPLSDTASTTTSLSSGKEAGIYKDYSETALADAKGQKVLFFHAPWCPQCRAIEDSIQKDKDAIPSGVTILKVDYDTNQKLRQKYGVTIQTTFVKIDDSGNLISKYIAYDEPTIESVKKNFLL